MFFSPLGDSMVTFRHFPDMVLGNYLLGFIIIRRRNFDLSFGSFSSFSSRVWERWGNNDGEMCKLCKISNVSRYGYFYKARSASSVWPSPNDIMRVYRINLRRERN